MLELQNICKFYRNGNVWTMALDSINLTFKKNEFVAVLGPSGCGKTTLLNIIGGLDVYTQDDLVLSGKALLNYRQSDLIINNVSTRKFTERDWDHYRSKRVGFIFQNYNLIPNISLLENVEMGMVFSGVSRAERRNRAIELLNRVGLQEHIYKSSAEISSGQKQRVAIARALVNDPDIILADEPTGALDDTSGYEVMQLIKEIAKDKLVIMVTHNEEIANQYATRIVRLKNGKLVDDVKNKPKFYHDPYQPDYRNMSYLTAFKLALNNVKYKVFRTLLIAFAGSIGIMGIALVLALSNGFSREINAIESETLSSMPIVISEFPRNHLSLGDIGDTLSNPVRAFNPISPGDETRHRNIIRQPYIDYLESIDPAWVDAIQYNYGVQLIFMSHIEGDIVTSASRQLMIRSLPNSPSYLNSQFTLEAGRFPTTPYEITVVVDSRNQIDASYLEFLNIDAEGMVSFDDILGKTLVIAINDDIDIDYDPVANIVLRNVDERSYSNGIQLTVTGVLRAIPGSVEADSSGIYYQSTLERAFIDLNINSDFCQVLNNTDTTDYTQAQLDGLSLQRIRNGCRDLPFLIRIYPTSIEAKEQVLLYLDAFNVGLPELGRIFYTDNAQLITDVLRSIINNISIILLSFSLIALMVSSIMIGMITYVTVLERTKEIGILRSVGARKKDITRIFNTETMIIGFIAGLLGVGLTLLSAIPLNMYLENFMIDFERLVVLRFDHAILLVAMSVILTFIAGLIPSLIAANKAPAIALKHNE